MITPYFKKVVKLGNQPKKKWWNSRTSRAYENGDFGPTTNEAQPPQTGTNLQVHLPGSGGHKWQVDIPGS